MQYQQKESTITYVNFLKEKNFMNYIGVCYYSQVNLCYINGMNDGDIWSLQQLWIRSA